MKRLSLTQSPLSPAEPGSAGAVLGGASMRWRWQPRRWLGRIGWPGVVAVGVLTVCAAFYYSTLRPIQARLDAAQQTTISLHEKIRQAEAAEKGGRPLADELTSYYRLFPKEKDLPDTLGKIFAFAKDQGLSLEHGEYRASPDKSGKLLRYQMTLPVKGEYPQIRKFIAGLAAEVPAVGLEQIQFERQKVSDRTVEAKIKLVLYLEQPS